MVQFLSPDVFVTEVQGKSGQIPAASTSAFALAGYSKRGPEGEAIISTSFTEYVNRFGGFSKKSLNTYAASAYFANGGNILIFVRELADDATLATGSFAGTWDVAASGRGDWANNAEVTISGNQNFYDTDTASYSRFDLEVSVIDETTGLLEVEETFDSLELDDTDSPDYILKVLEVGSEDVVFTAVSGGVPIELRPVTVTGESVGTGNGVSGDFSVDLVGEPIAEGTLDIKVDGVLIAEDDGDGNIAGVSGTPSVSGTIDYTTGALAVSISPAPAISAAITADYITAPASSVTITLSGGSDGSTVASADVVGQDLQANKRGIYALDAIENQFSLSLPDYAGDLTTATSLIAYAEGRKDVVVILEPPKGSTPSAAVTYRRQTLKSQTSFGAMYYPWVKMPDPLNRNRPITVPPAGHVAGRYAFTDINESVGKAPAGTVRGQLQLISGLERILTKGDRNLVHPAQINAIRSDANVGTAIWGNSTLQVVGDFTDVNIRRTFIFLAESQQVGLLDIVFQDIGPVTFGIIKTRLDQFLEAQFLNGVIGSGIPDKNQAFKVIVDETNNPEATQLRKIINIDEFIKPNIAAEFIHLRLQRVFDASEV